jgi:DNA-binding transcriptional LysR family regulator
MLEETQYLYEVCRERSFSQAAKNLYISQPALSAAVKKVEDRLGVRLFDRRTSPLTLTEEGKLYMQALEQIRAIESDLLTHLGDLSDLRTGHLTVSGGNFVSSFILPKIILNFTSRYEGIRVGLEESNTPDLQSRLLDNSVDLLVAHNFDPALFTAYPLLDETLLLCVPRSFAVNDALQELRLTDAEVRRGHDREHPGVPLELFREEPFLLLKKGNDINAHANRLCEQAGFTPHVLIELDQLITAYNMCNAGLGVTFVSDAVVRSTPPIGNCYFYKIQSGNTHRRLCIGHKKGKYISRAVQAFLDVARETYRYEG